MCPPRPQHLSNGLLPHPLSPPTPHVFSTVSFGGRRGPRLSLVAGGPGPGNFVRGARPRLSLPARKVPAAPPTPLERIASPPPFPAHSHVFSTVSVGGRRGPRLSL